MSTRVLRNPPPRGNRRRGGAVGLDLNIAQPGQNSSIEGISSGLISQPAKPRQPIPPTPIDVDAIDEEVLFTSPRAFAQAKKNSRRHRGANTVVDVDSDERISRFVAGNFPKRQRTIFNYDQIINLESSSNFQKKNMKKVSEEPKTIPPPPLPPPELTFSCPICFGQLEEEMSTKCGHIFCKRCIKAAIAVKPKCPTCRKKVTAKDIIRIYLPTSR